MIHATLEYYCIVEVLGYHRPMITSIKLRDRLRLYKINEIFRLSLTTLNLIDKMSTDKLELGGRTVISQIGHGSYSIVYDVLSPKKSTRQAIKLNFVDPRLSGPSYKEIIANLNLNHHYLMRIRDISEGDLISQCCGHYDDRSYKIFKPDSLHFIYPLADTNLTLWMSYNRRHLTYDNAMIICSQIGMGLEYMHSMKYIHRDLKPQNILVCSENGSLRCKIGDMGMSKYYIKNDKHSLLVTSGNYRAPEVVMGYSKYDLGMDVWSLGCVFYEIFCGKLMIALDEDSDYLILSKLKETLPYQVSSSYVKEINRKYILHMINCDVNPYEKFEDTIKSIRDSTSKQMIDRFFSLILKMLRFDHRTRPTITEVMDDHNFDPFRNVINETRVANHIPQQKPMVRVVKCTERSRMYSIINRIFFNRSGYKWYSHRTLLTTLYNIDRLISINPSFILANGIDVTFYALLYISFKVVVDNGDEMSIYDVLSGLSTNIVSSLNIELELFKNQFRYDVFYPTMYDYGLDIREITDQEVHSMIQFIENGDHQCLTSEQAYNKWLKK